MYYLESNTKSVFKNPKALLYHGIRVDGVFRRPITGSPYRFSSHTQILPKMKVKFPLSSPTRLLQLKQFNTNKIISNPGIFLPMTYLTGVGKTTQLYKTTKQKFRSGTYTDKKLKLAKSKSPFPLRFFGQRKYSFMEAAEMKGGDDWSTSTGKNAPAMEAVVLHKDKMAGTFMEDVACEKEGKKGKLKCFEKGKEQPSLLMKKKRHTDFGKISNEDINPTKQPCGPAFPHSPKTINPFNNSFFY
ncbi:unnamed protein product [Amaranthus hypochondriacus]